MWPWSENRLLKSALRLYAGEHVLAKVLREGENGLTLNAQRADLTIMFIDIAGFTAAENAFPSDQLVDFINAYLQTVSECIFAHHGVLDNYTGDAITAWWRDANSACICAKQIVEKVELLNVGNSRANRAKIKVGIGINSGPVRLGNYGSTRRIKFTVLGDNVNLASRLCTLANSRYPVPIIISDATKQLVDETLATKLLDTVQVKGRDDAIQLYSL